MSSWKRNLLIGLAAAAIAAGVVIAIVSGGGGGHSPKRHGRLAGGRGDLIAAARYLGVPAVKLRADLGEGKTIGQLAQRTPGRSRAGVIDAIVKSKTSKLRPGVATGIRLSRIRARAAIEVEQPYAVLARQMSPLGLAAKYLGRTVADLRRERRAGRSLAKLADATPGKSAAGLTELLATDRRRAIRRAFARGALSAEAERKLLAAVKTRTTAFVNR
jgi:hypothetical protein